MRRLIPFAAAMALLLAAVVPATAGTAPTLTQYCTNSAIAYTVALPGGWYYNTRVEAEEPVEDVDACRFFSPSDFTVTPGAEPSGIAIGIFYGSGSIGDGEALTVDGFDAVRREVGDEGDMTYIVEIQVTEDFTMSLQTNQTWEGDYSENQAIIDQQAAGMEIHPFADIADSPFVWEIAEVFDFGVTSGCGPNAYCPENAVTRAQMAAFLARAYDLPPATGDYFADDDSSIHEWAINRVAEAGISFGCGPMQFCPTILVNRAEMASFIARAADLGPPTSDYFTDDESSIHEFDINRLAEAGITTGCGPDTYCPGLAVTRGQMAAFLYRALVG